MKKFLKRGLIVLILVGVQSFIIITGFTTGSYWAHRKNMHKLWKQQQSFNDTVASAIEKLAATTKHNFEFNQTNKEIIKNVAELYVPDEVALLRRIPAKP